MEVNGNSRLDAVELAKVQHLAAIGRFGAHVVKVGIKEQARGPVAQAGGGRVGHGGGGAARAAFCYCQAARRTAQQLSGRDSRVGVAVVDGLHGVSVDAGEEHADQQALVKRREVRRERAGGSKRKGAAGMRGARRQRAHATTDL